MLHSPVAAEDEREVAVKGRVVNCDDTEKIVLRLRILTIIKHDHWLLGRFFGTVNSRGSAENVEIGHFPVRGLLLERSNAIAMSIYYD
jgi:hypothetical protein